MFGLRFDFPELAIVFIACITYVMLGSQLLAGMALAIGFALVVMYRS